MLAFKPGFDAMVFYGKVQNSCCENACSNSDDLKGTSDDKKSNDCNGLGCNPFLSCGTCFLYVFNVSIEKVVKSDFNIDNVFAYDFFLTALFSSDFWQPPKFV